MTLRVGSLCSGYGGLEIALREVFDDIDLRWVSDNDPGAAKILAYRFPEVQNLGNIFEVNFAHVEAVDILTAGFPCTDVSGAGKKEGLAKHTRTGLWYEVARAIRELNPPVVILENVLGLLSGRAHSDLEWCPGCMGDDPDGIVLRALGCVLGDLATLGYDAEWETVPASAAGAPHRRERVFVLATRSPDTQQQGLEVGEVQSHGQERAPAV